MRKSFRGGQNTFRQDAGRPKFAGCVLALMLLAISAVANPQLDTTNPTSFFTNVAMAMFQQMNLHDFNGNLVTITNIPVYEDPARFGGMNINYYTPAVHRILQLAANIFDATTNRFIDGGPTNYPTVFRPIFSSQNGIATISGYEEVTNPADAFLPMLNASDFVQAPQRANSSINMYGVPWVIGAKKGFPNFNEFSMANSLTVQRKLQFTNIAALGPPWRTNQVYNFFVTNSFGLEAWNSYTDSYARPLQLVASNEVSIIVTNETGPPLLEVTNLAFGTITNITGWSGAASADSFKVPLFVSQFYTSGTSNVLDATYVPHLWLILQFKLQYVLIDSSANRVIDFVNLVDNEPLVDVDSMLQGNFTTQRDQTTEYDVWETNLLNGGASFGVLNQIDVGTGIPANYQNWVDPNKARDEENFAVRLNNQVTNNVFDPYVAQATVWQLISWQANDPLVHYTARDLTSTNGLSSFYNTNGVQFSGTPVSTAASLPNLGKLNVTYQPWGGDPQNPNSPMFDRNYQVKDPLVFQSDDWNFPTGQSLTFDWLGRVHRGTPWQTVFLKPSNQSLALWSLWNNDNILVTNGNSIFMDAAFTHPTNDWRIASLWAQWVNTNDLSTLLSINNTDTNAWAARLDGLTALTNSAPGELDPITITSNSPQAGFIAQAIQIARANTNAAGGAAFPNGFQQVGDVLATPQLSVASPCLNTNGLSSLAANGITDEALEIIPTQLLPLLRLDSFGQIAPANGQVELSFSGYDGHTYAIQASSNLTDWVVISTNCPSDGSFGITNALSSGQEFYRSVLVQ